MNVNDPVLDYYADYDEDARLTGRRQVELVRTRQILSRTLPGPPARVLDVGGGTGVHALWLTRCGFEVELFDLVPHHVESAAALGGFSAEVADARHIPREDRSADAVLLLGPLYHLIERTDRVAALRESHRLLEPGGVLVAAALSRFAGVLDPRMRENDSPEQLAAFQRNVDDGTMRWGGSDVANAYAHTPGGLVAEIEEAGFAAPALIAVEGFAWPAGLADDDPSPELLRVLELTESEPSMLGATAHLVAVAHR